MKDVRIIDEAASHVNKTTDGVVRGWYHILKKQKQTQLQLYNYPCCYNCSVGRYQLPHASVSKAPVGSATRCCISDVYPDEPRPKHPVTVSLPVCNPPHQPIKPIPPDNTTHFQDKQVKQDIQFKREHQICKQTAKQSCDGSLTWPPRVAHVGDRAGTPWHTDARGDQRESRLEKDGEWGGGEVGVWEFSLS